MLEPMMMQVNSKDELIKAVSVMESKVKRKKLENFRAAEQCSRCPKNGVPCSWLNGWCCADCFERFAETALGGCLLTGVMGHESKKNYDSSNGQDEAIKLKGYRKQ